MDEASDDLNEQQDLSADAWPASGLCTKADLSFINRHIGTRIKIRRRQLHLSQGKLSDAIGFTFQQMQKYEYGANRIGAATLYAMSAALQVPITYFFEALPAQDGTVSIPNPAGDELLHLFHQLPVEAQNHMLALLHTLSPLNCAWNERLTSNQSGRRKS
jgi:transcriptional regulator with XRE-family HTH domain